ncbi:MAG: hypothetical protein IT200_08110 [Thermoleophilia bacterium]|nr:hypothetical protein [Thermoleophilia bacterium]
MTTTLRSLPALALLLLAVLVAQPSAAAQAHRPGDVALRQATALSAQWGRCPTSPPAHRALAAARTAPHPARAVRARAALRAWRQVVRECSAPVPMPVADPTA